MALSHADHIAHLRAEVALVTSALLGADLDAPVTSCPGWVARDLAVHLGTVHGWAAQAAATGAKVMFSPGEPPADDELAGWYAARAERLVEVLDGLDPEGPTWHIFPVERLNRVWSRRQAQETLVHRWDLEAALGATTPMKPELAADGIDEYFELVVPRILSRGTVNLPVASLHVHCTDTAGEWLVRSGDDGAFVLTREHAKGDAALRGAAENLLLALWGRTAPSAPGAGVDVVGDQAAADAWLAIGGN